MDDTVRIPYHEYVALLTVASAAVRIAELLQEFKGEDQLATNTIAHRLASIRREGEKLKKL